MCEVGKDKADVQLTLEIHAERGPANTKGIAEFNYFVAVLGPDKEILTRENFTSVVQFQGTDTEVRSEEHTSELQSLMRISYAVFCLKKQKNIYRRNQNKT